MLQNEIETQVFLRVNWKYRSIDDIKTPSKKLARAAPSRHFPSITSSCWKRTLIALNYKTTPLSRKWQKVSTFLLKLL